MHYNPFAAKLLVVVDEIKNLENDRAELLEQVAWATRFNPDKEVDEIARLRSDRELLNAELARLGEDTDELSATFRELASETPGHEGDARIGLSVHRWFTAEYRLAKKRLGDHKQELAHLRRRVQVANEERERVGRGLIALTDQVLEREQALTRFRSFRSVEADEAIAKIDGELALLRKSQAHIEARVADVERAVETPLAELRKYEAEIEDNQSEISSLKSELARLDRQIADAERLDGKLAGAADASARYKLHQECEREFGISSPRQVISDTRSQMRPKSSRVRELERQIDRNLRHSTKTKQRITKLAEVAARDIDALVIDGNNCCYEGDDFIGLAALIPMTGNLAERYAVTVIFDASIRDLLGVSDRDLRAALHVPTVHVVAPEGKADETILDAADAPTTFVISNDRFGDYRDKAAVKERRVIRHEILLGRIWVHDLGVNELLALPSGT